MSEQSRSYLKSRFEDGDTPTGADFANLIDSFYNKVDDEDEISSGVFVDMWLSAGDFGGEQVTSVDFSQAEPFECNEVRMGYEEALRVYRNTGPRQGAPHYGCAQFRTNLPSRSAPQPLMQNMMAYNTVLEVALLPWYYSSREAMPANLNAAFQGCGKLRRIVNVIDVRNITTKAGFTYAFQGCVALEDLRLRNLKVDIDLSDCKSLSMDSLGFMVTNATNTSAITITVHPDVYAKLTDELIADAAAKNITFATT